MILEEKILNILKKEKYAYIATTNNTYVDCAVIAFSNIGFNIYFGAFSNTLKGKNIQQNNYVGLAITTLQIHGEVIIIEHGTEEYQEKVKVYNEKFPQWEHVFKKEKNELYKIEPLVIWDYNPQKGEMHRDVIVFDEEYYKTLDPYIPPKEFKYRK